MKKVTQNLMNKYLQNLLQFFFRFRFTRYSLHLFQAFVYFTLWKFARSLGFFVVNSTFDSLKLILFYLVLFCISRNPFFILLFEFNHSCSICTRSISIFYEARRDADNEPSLFPLPSFSQFYSNYSFHSQKCSVSIASRTAIGNHHCFV